MIDKIKAEADAIPCGKDEKIKALEALLKLAIQERDEALAYGERQNKALIDAMEWNWIDAVEESGYGHFDIEDMQSIYDTASERPSAALAALKAEWQAEALKEIARIAHHGGLIGFSSDADAMIEIRRLTIGAWDKRAKEAGDE